MAIIGGYASPASLYLEGSAMTMIDRNRKLRPPFARKPEGVDTVALDSLPDPDPYEWPTASRHNHFTRDIKAEGICPGCDAVHRQSEPEPKHRADVEPETAVAQCCGQVICCPTCNEPVGA